MANSLARCSQLGASEVMGSRELISRINYNSLDPRGVVGFPIEIIVFVLYYFFVRYSVRYFRGDDNAIWTNW